MIETHNTIVISGLGLVSSIGTNADVAAAAYLAGVVRRSEDNGLLVFDEDEGDFLPISTHRVPILSHGFSGLGRLTLLGVEALHSLLNDVEKDSVNPTKTGIYISFPCAVKLKNIYECKSKLKDNKDLLSVCKHSAFSLDNESSNSYKAVVKNTLEIAGFSVSLNQIHITGGGSASIALSIQLASKDLNEGKFESCIVGTFDSFVDSKLVKLLHDDKRIKHGGNPAGFLAGEAGGLLLLETNFTAISKNRTFEVAISAVSVQEEKSHYFTNEPTSGAALAATTFDVLNSSDKNKSSRIFISDHNGESFKATELASMMVKLRSQDIDLDDIKIFTPVESFGETGSANAVVAICIANRILGKNYFNTEDAVILSSSLTNERASIRLARVN